MTLLEFLLEPEEGARRKEPRMAGGRDVIAGGGCGDMIMNTSTLKSFYNASFVCSP